MPGQPKTRALIARVDEQGGVTALLERIGAGESMTKIAESFETSRQSLSKIINVEEHRDALRGARQEAAHVFAEDAVIISDEATPKDAQVAKLRSDTRRWLAGKWNKDQYGDQGGINVNLSVGQLHLDSLRNASKPRENDAPAPAALPANA